MSEPNLDSNDIVQEIPIFLSQQLSNNLYIVQHPVRPHNNPYTGINAPCEARFKQDSVKLELDIPLQTNSKWYDHERGKDLALGLNDKEAKTIYDRTWRRDQSEGLLDRQTLQSTIVPQQANYWMGVVKDGNLHLTPIRSTFQLRPGLKYLDKIDEKQKNANKKAQAMEEEDTNNEFGSINGGNKQSTDEFIIGSSKTKITGKVKGKNTETNTEKSSIKKNVRTNAQRFNDEEKWKKMKYYDYDVSRNKIVGKILFLTFVY
ncbi:23372_t:CDS:2 [Entrophospora sp. SA101]|nr:15272_t:CDS:2 [Entrophospora sp. SA101]CAJ0651073.1 15066_t:CDS:2 [Entrophospora sp. SA101]CAJ0753468.1 23372_t:CDS:2 [Entrophospora sp. SA101]CAJ0831212.1 22426_t:CDS:2 [Entrophospora sp. SA101]CAJ0845430.1 14445_t:CDS:2 [Entrophospora sp. SA101]